MALLGGLSNAPADGDVRSRGRLAGLWADDGAFRRVVRRFGSIVVVALLTAFLLVTGGPDSPFQDLFVIVLVLSATTQSWRRWGLDVGATALGTWLVGALGAGDIAYWQDLAIDLAVWLVVSLAAGVVTRRLARTSRTARDLQSGVDLLQDAVLVVDADDLRIQYANRAATDLAHGDGILGRTPEEAGPWPAADCLRTALREGAQVTQVQGADGRVLEVRTEPVQRASGPALVVLTRDVTERAEHEQRLAERERRFRALAEDASGVVYRVRLDEGGRAEVEYIGPQLQDVLGYSVDSLREDPGLIVRHMHPEDRSLIDLRSDAHVYGEPGVHSYRVRHVDGHWVWLEDHHTPELDGEGRLVAVQGIAFDASVRQAAEEAADEARRQRAVAEEIAGRTAQIERTLLQSLSHELRTPMHAVIGFARTLEARLGMLSNHEQGMLVERLLINAVRLDDLLQTLLDFERTTRGEGDLHRRLARVDKVVGEVAEAVPLHGRRLRTRLEPVEALIDRPQVERSVERLLGNAVRHTPKEAMIDLRVEGVNGVARIVVEDDGPGLQPHLAETVFEPFRQGPHVEHDASPGVGLGLSMVRACARRHGGDARYEPVDPQGARFVLEIPRVAGDVAGED